MFELEREVRAWSEAAFAARCRSGASVAELGDHLYCEIDRARAGGMTDEQAFAAAVARLGPVAELAAEHAKNRSVWAAGCAIAARFERGASGVRQRRLLIAHAIVWATVVIAASLLMKRSAGTASAEWLIFLILIPCWLGSEQILRQAMRRPSDGGAR